MDKLTAPVLDVAYGDARPSGRPVCIGVPFPRGVCAASAPVEVTGPDGQAVAAAVKPLARWDDDSVRWGLVTFGARTAGRHSVQPGASGPAPAQPVTVEEADETIRLANGPVELTLAAKGPGPIAALSVNGQPVISGPEAFRLEVDAADTRHETQRRLTVLDASPVRVRVRVEGAHVTPAGERRLAYRLDVELWAGMPAVRLDHWFFHTEADTPELSINRIAMVCDLALGEGEEGAGLHRHFQQTNHGLFYVPRQVLNLDPVAIVADFERGGPHVEDEAMLLDEVDYPFYLDPPLVDSASWLGVTDGERSVYVQMQDFDRTKPKRIASAGRQLAVEAWPAAAGTMKLPQGRSRRQVITLGILDASDPLLADAGAKLDARAQVAGAGVGRLLQSAWHEGNATVDPAWLAACEEYDQQHVLRFGEHARFERTLRSIARLDMPDTMFDVGDTIDSGYTANYTRSGGEQKVPRLEGAPAVPHCWPKGRPTQTYIDLHEPVWTNNEYDAIWAFACETMRSGRQDLIDTLRLAARHNIEVDFLHYSDHKWLHRATPAHSANHTTTGAYPSHFWTQGLLAWYCMTGDADALEVAVALGEKVIENLTDPELRPIQWGFNREIGWSVLSLAHLMDVTGDTRFESLCTELVDYLVAFDRNAFSGAINLSAGNDRLSMNRQIIDNFFGYASMVEGVDKYVQVTGRQDVADWLTQFFNDLAQAAMDAAREGALGASMLGLGMAIAYERTGDRRFLDVAMVWLDQMFWLNAGGGNGEIKPVATSYKGLVRVLGHLQRQGMLDRFEYPSVRALRQSGD